MPFVVQLCWTLGLEDPVDSSWAAKGAANNEPLRAFEMAAEIADQSIRHEAVGASLSALARTDPEGALERLIESGVDDAVRQRVEHDVSEAILLRRVLSDN